MFLPQIRSLWVSHPICPIRHGKPVKLALKTDVSKPHNNIRHVNRHVPLHRQSHHSIHRLYGKSVALCHIDTLILDYQERFDLCIRLNISRVCPTCQSLPNPGSVIRKSRSHQSNTHELFCVCGILVDLLDPSLVPSTVRMRLQNIRVFPLPLIQRLQFTNGNFLEPLFEHDIHQLVPTQSRRIKLGATRWNHIQILLLFTILLQWFSLLRRKIWRSTNT